MKGHQPIGLAIAVALTIATMFCVGTPSMQKQTVQAIKPTQTTANAASSATPPLSENMAAESVKPAIVSVLTFTHASLSAQPPDINVYALNEQLASKSENNNGSDIVSNATTDMIYHNNSSSINNTGIISNSTYGTEDPNSKLDTILNIIQDDPATYLVPGTSSSLLLPTPSLSSGTSDNDIMSFITEYFAGYGTGFIITPDGYTATSAHIVLPDKKADVDKHIRYHYDDENIFQEKAQAVSRYILEYEIPKYFPDLASVEPTEEEVATLTSAIVQYYLANYHIDSVEPLVYVHTSFSLPNAFGLTLPGYNRTITVVRAEGIPEATGQYPGKDVAVIKIDAGAQTGNLPTIPLGDEKYLKPLDDIIAVGYPAAVSESPILAGSLLPTFSQEEQQLSHPQIQQQLVEPSTTEGKFSGFQPTVFGFNLVQASTPISAGSSGSPAIDSSGNVVGIAALMTYDSSSEQFENASYNFFMPVSILKEFLDRINVHPQESLFTKMYRQGLSSYEVQEYSKSLQIFEQLDKLISGNPDVENHMQQSIILSNKPEQLGHQQQLQNKSNTTSNFKQGSSI